MKAWEVVKGWLQLRKTTEPKTPNQRRVSSSGQTAAGVYVTPERALMQDVVYAARRYLSQTVAQLPATIVKSLPDGGREIIASHRIDDLLNLRPNPELSPFQLRETLTAWAIMHGNGVAEIELDQAYRPINLWPIHPDRIHYVRDLETQELIYRINNGIDGRTVDLTANQVIHVRGYGDGPVGNSVIEYAAQTIGWARATELFGASFFGQGLHFGGAVILKQKADAETVQTIREELDSVYRGPANASKWFVGDQEMTVTRTSSTPDESQFIETMQFQVESLCRWMNCPPHKVYHLLRMTYNNVEQASIDVVGDSIVPWANRWEQECTYKLFGQNRSSLKVKFEVKALLRGDNKSRQEALEIQRRNGIVSGDTWAQIEDLPKPGKANGGDIYIVESNMTRMDKVGENMVKPAAPATSPVRKAEPANPAAAANLAQIRAQMRLPAVLGVGV